MSIKDEILKLVEQITPTDGLEREHINDTIQWIKSGAELFRIQKPDIPPKHLVSYFVVIDPKENKILLIDHIKAQLWLPAGGHVEPNEHPKATVEREVVEELNIQADFLYDGIFFLTQAVTVNLTAGHTDVSLWYVLKADSNAPLQYDPGEFNGYKWFSPEEILETPIEKLDPHLHRFVKKWIAHREASDSDHGIK
ncbi:MAG: NUDIX domain-containing protein [Candidatus Buchananbacteria bacterium]|nr:NUDIX domain-containing protein [Candidatus Buchananbacteria bacterium]